MKRFVVLGLSASLVTLASCGKVHDGRDSSAPAAAPAPSGDSSASQSEIDALKQEITKLQLQIDNLNKLNISTEIQNLQTQINNITNEIKNINTAIDNSQTITNIKNEITEVQTEVNLPTNVLKIKNNYLNGQYTDQVQINTQNGTVNFELKMDNNQNRNNILGTFTLLNTGTENNVGFYNEDGDNVLDNFQSFTFTADNPSEKTQYTLIEECGCKLASFAILSADIPLTDSKGNLNNYGIALQKILPKTDSGVLATTFHIDYLDVKSLEKNSFNKDRANEIFVSSVGELDKSILSPSK